MGLLTGLLTLPLLPVRGVVGIADLLAQQAERELHGDEKQIRDDLAELQRAAALGAVDPNEYAELEDELLARLAAARRREAP